MDLMIEAKDKEQAVFELMRTFKLPGFEKISDVIPYTRNDDNKIAEAASKKKARKGKKSAAEEEEPPIELVSEEEVGMGGPDGRVYWPPGMEDWLRPKKREVKKKEPAEQSKEQARKKAAELYAETAEEARARRRAQHEKAQKEGLEAEEVRRLNMEEGVEDLDEEEASQLTHLDCFVGQPLPGDEILEAIPVCAPWQALAQYKYKAKMQPGQTKKGKAVREILSTCVRRIFDLRLQTCFHHRMPLSKPYSCRAN